jgi:GTPase SAR1 family protein
MAVQIKEIKNDKLKLQEIKMANDAIIKGVEKPLPTAYNFFLLVVGAPGSGKSSLWINLITKKESNTYYRKFDKILIFSNSFKTITTEIHLPPERIFDGIGDLEYVIDSVKDSDDKILIILDDVVADVKNESHMLKLIYNRRHLAGGISIILTTQVYNKVPLALRKAASDLILFTTGNKKELKSVYNDFINIPEDAFYKITQHSFKSKHDFLVYTTDSGSFYHNFNLLVLDFD